MATKLGFKEAFDEFFSGVKFDSSLNSKIVQNNIEFITSTDDHKQLFGGKAIGCYYLAYDFRHKDTFYNNLFDIGTDEVIDMIKGITTIEKSFKIARDDVNLTCFYIAHRFLSNPQLSSKQQIEFAKNILDYFSYRTLVLLHSGYWIYPIAKEKAVSLSERLSNRYIIKQLKNWNEYCKYRSEQYLDTKHLSILKKLTDDKAMPNAITDLYGKTKSTIKNIYREFVDMMEQDEGMGSSRSVINDIEGNEVLLDRTGGSESYVIKVENMLTDESSFLLNGHIKASCDIIPSVSITQLTDTLKYIVDYTYIKSSSRDEIYKLVRSIIVNSIDYLNKSELYLGTQTSVITMIDNLVGNVLYARGTDLEINRLKDQLQKLIKKLYKINKVKISDRNANNIRNAVYVYILLLALV